MISFLIFFGCYVGSYGLSYTVSSLIYAEDLKRYMYENDADVDEAAANVPVSDGLVALDRFAAFAMCFITLTLFWKGL
jgi:hypothetical protein